jgi:RHS repeat-associated protein
MDTLTRAGVTTRYSYDPLGRRVRKVSSTGAASTVLFAYDQSGQLLGEYDSSGKALREYVWMGSTPVAMFTPDAAAPTGNPIPYYIYTDHLDTPRVVIDKNNGRRWRWLAEPFGTTAPETNPEGRGVFTQNLRFPGQYADQESGLFYNYFRDYDASTGKYIESDPIGLNGGFNTYAYVNANPLSLVDSLGLFSRTNTSISLQKMIEPMRIATKNSPWPWIRIGGGAFIAGFDTYQACHAEDCRKKIEAIYSAMKELETRLTDLYIDKYNQKVVAQCKPSPSLPKGSGSWNGHIQALEQEKTRLRNAIQDALDSYCEEFVPPFAYKLAFVKSPPRINCP